MKNLVFLLMAGLLTALIISCNEAPSSENNAEEAATEENVGEVTEAMADAPAENWEEAKEAYHEIMADVFHSAEEGNLDPLKKQSRRTWNRCSGME